MNILSFMVKKEKDITVNDLFLFVTLKKIKFRPLVIYRK